MIHGSLARGVAMYPRIATPYTVCLCHWRPSTRPSVDRAPSATIRCPQLTSAPLSSNTEETRPAESWLTSTAFTPSIILAPSSTATIRMRSSSSVRGTALLTFGNDAPGHGISTSAPKPDIRSPWWAMRPSSHGPRPSCCISAIARGVRPSPHALSRGNWAESITSTSRPLRAAQAAAADPAGPAPTTTTSALMFMYPSMLAG